MLAAIETCTPTTYVSLAGTHPGSAAANDHRYAYRTASRTRARRDNTLRGGEWSRFDVEVYDTLDVSLGALATLPVSINDYTHVAPLVLDPAPAYGERSDRARRDRGSSTSRPQTTRPGLRRVLLRKFPYAVIYTVRPDHTLVLAVMRCSQHPDYWRGRPTGGTKSG